MDSSIIVDAISYIPEYNPETKKYEDENPIPPRKKGYRYKCSCNHGNTIFTRSSEFTQHFKLKIHRDYIENYDRTIKDITDANDRIKQFQILTEKQQLIIKRKDKQIRELEREVNKLKEKDKEKQVYYDELD